MKRLAIISIVMCLFIAGCDQKPEAPFGFKWGQSLSEVEKLELSKFKVDGEPTFMQFASVDNAPQEVYDAQWFQLAFMPASGLMGITMFSNGVDENSYYFNTGRTLYNKLSLMLEDKYGKPKEISEKVNKDGNDFYFCLQDKTCGTWQREYSKDGVNVTLSVRSSPGQLLASQPKANIQVSYEYYPDDVMKKDKEFFESIKNKEKKDSIKNNY
ncbi:Uncharacterised protein [Yersinia rohdei]|uniref:hypothetical protein n=1 Tax=Yersinia rohdei TaxID=29485 RepID=UPI00061C31AF|nr:hypothetical protein [Yersinia rohdei]CNE63478.1 Uncharacterised protein [Yersinia rohdei]